MLHRRQDMSAATLRKLRGVLQRVIAAAVRRHHVAHNVALQARLPRAAVKRAAERPAKRALAPDEARTVLEALRDERNGAMFALSLRVGLRPGEAAALWWDDLDGKVLQIRRGVRIVHGNPSVVEVLKTEASRRTIEVPTDLVAMIEDHRRDQRVERLTAERWDDTRLMFASTNGRVLSPSNVRRQLAAICDRAGVPVVTPNELRHSCASLLSDLGVPNEQIADLLGHTTSRMVELTYRHRLHPVVDVAVRADWVTSTGP
jgi:integrase